MIVDNAVAAESLVIRRLSVKMAARVKSGERSSVLNSIVSVGSRFHERLELKALCEKLHAMSADLAMKLTHAVPDVSRILTMSNCAASFGSGNHESFGASDKTPRCSRVLRLIS